MPLGGSETGSPTHRLNRRGTHACAGYVVSAAVPACCLEGVRWSTAGGRWGQHLALGTNLLVDAFLQDRAWCARIMLMASKALGWPKIRKLAHLFPWQYRAIKCLSWPKFWANVASFSRLSSGDRLGGTAARRRRNKSATRCRVYKVDRVVLRLETGRCDELVAVLRASGARVLPRARETAGSRGCTCTPWVTP